MWRKTPIPKLLALTALSAGCASSPVDNAPRALLDECRGEVADLADREQAPAVGDAVPGNAGADDTAVDTPIDAARTARAEAPGSSLADWPEDALLYRCLAARGVVLTREQANILAEWQGRVNESAGRGADDGRD